jgi:hypothetical protein
MRMSSYDGFSNPSSAIADAETSLEIRQDNSSADLVSFYLAGTRRVSRSHLSHLYLSSSLDTRTFTNPQTPPFPELDQAIEAQYTFLLCTPHYVADRKTLNLRLEELVSLLTTDKILNENDLQAEIGRAQIVLWAPQYQNPGVSSTLRTPVSPIKMRLPSTGRFQRTAVTAQEVVCQ